MKKWMLVIMALSTFSLLAETESDWSFIQTNDFLGRLVIAKKGDSEFHILKDIEADVEGSLALENKICSRFDGTNTANGFCKIDESFLVVKNGKNNIHETYFVKKVSGDLEVKELLENLKNSGTKD